MARSGGTFVPADRYLADAIIEGNVLMAVSATGGSAANEDPSMDRQVGSRDWKLKDCDGETIKIAKTCAKANGMRISTWVARAIRMASEEDVAERNSATPQNEFNAEEWKKDILQDIAMTLSRYDEKVDQYRKDTADKLNSVRDDLRIIALGLLPKISDGNKI